MKQTAELTMKHVSHDIKTECRAVCTPAALLLIIALFVSSAPGVMDHARAQELGAYSVEYEYDGAARLVGFRLDAENSITYSYDDGGNITARITNGESDTASETDPTLPDRVRLHSAYPNPFNPSTVIGFDLPASQAVRIAVYDGIGRRVALLVDGEQPAGRHQVRWNASGLGSGTYFVRMTAEGDTAFTRAVMLVR